jgi:hypothetical protein
MSVAATAAACRHSTRGIRVRVNTMGPRLLSSAAELSYESCTGAAEVTRIVAEELGSCAIAEQLSS